MAKGGDTRPQFQAVRSTGQALYHINESERLDFSRITTRTTIFGSMS